MNIQIMIGLLIPFLGTSLGSLMVFFIKDKISEKFQVFLMSFASGIMIAASVFSLLIPAIEMSAGMGKLSFLPAILGFILGNIFLFFLDKIISFIDQRKLNEQSNTLREKSMLFFSVTLHNIPEGMIVGIMFSALLVQDISVTFTAAMALSIGIAIQNIPEGSIISIPLKLNGMSQFKAFLYGVLSGVVEPIGAIITLLLTSYIIPFIPYMLSFAAGTMMYVVFDELVPEQKSRCTTLGALSGFVVMMFLDIVLG
ncbi:MAG: ZIP family metal transporter [Clostridia bacterium]|nr:ZIP family metal transporter [Clostridia bacterium]